MTYHKLLGNRSNARLQQRIFEIFGLFEKIVMNYEVQKAENN